GSCLGPLLYVIYASKLFGIIEKHLPDAHCFADDSQLYLAFKPDSYMEQNKALAAMENCIRDIRSWMRNDRLLLNDDKTEFLIIGTKQQLAKVNISQIKIGDLVVDKSKVVRNLGSWFDERFIMETHINKVCKTAFYHLHNIRRIRKYLSPESAEILVHAFITTRLDYCKSLMFGVPQYELAKLQRVQNAAARLICKLPASSPGANKKFHASHYMKGLHEVVRRDEQAQGFMAPGDEAVSTGFQLIIPSRNNLRNNEETLLVPPPGKSLISSDYCNILFSST
ncbi:Hypothetical predicted protein, partial [Paramuricea clavata]